MHFIKPLLESAYDPPPEEKLDQRIDPIESTTSTIIYDVTEKTKISKRSASDSEFLSQSISQDENSRDISSESSENFDSNSDSSWNSEYPTVIEPVLKFTPESGKRLISPFINIETIKVRENEEEKFNLPVQKLPSGQSIQESNKKRIFEGSIVS